MNFTARKQHVIPKFAWFLAFFLYAVIGTLIFEFGLDDPQFASWPMPGRLALAYGATLILAAFVLLFGYIYGDAKRRRMRYVLWTLLAIFVPNAIGIILYFILRNPLPAFCPSCGKTVDPSFAFCPSCSASLQATCPQCGLAVDRAWAHCPKCGTKLPARAPHQSAGPASAALHPTPS